MKRIFISFSIEDEKLRDLLIGQSKNEKSPFEFVDMSVKKPWDEKWKTNCKTRIKGCDGVISIITENTENADGQIWEMECAIKENIPIIGIYGNCNHTKIEIKVKDKKIKLKDWTWENISNWINNI